MKKGFTLNHKSNTLNSPYIAKTHGKWKGIMSARNKLGSGFTLIEILVVLALMALFIGLVSYFLSPIIDSTKVRYTMNEIVSQLEKGRQKALSSQIETEFLFKEDFYEMTEEGTTKRYYLPNGVKIKKEKKVKFSSTGLPQPGYFGTIEISCRQFKKKIIISQMGRIRTE